MSLPESPTATPPREILTAITAGAVLLLVVHTLGRFYYTPLLPHLVDDGLLSTQQGAAVATWNYLGYLMGAMLAVRWHRIDQIRRILPVAMLLHVLTTLLQTQLDHVASLSLIRWVNGLVNGLVFVQAPALVLEWLVLRNRASLSGLIYLGVGIGLLVSSALVSLTVDWLSGAARWWPAALVSIPLSWWGASRLGRLNVPARENGARAAVSDRSRLLDRASAPLLLSYAGAGMGYILPMTFLPLLARLQLPPGHWLVNGSWLILALATIPSTWLWNRLGAGMGDLPAMRINFAIQLVGVLAPVVWPGPVGLSLCAVLVGSTFVGTVLLTQRVGRALHPHQGPRLAALLVAIFSMTQMAGPWLAKQWLGMGGSLASTFWIGVLALAWGLLFSLLVPRPEDWHGA